MSGGKITDSHSTVTEAAEKVTKVAKKIPAIKLIGFGEITRASGGNHRISVKSKDKRALVLQIRMPQSIQLITLYTDSVEFVLKELRKKLAIIE